MGVCVCQCVGAWGLSMGTYVWMGVGLYWLCEYGRVMFLGVNVCAESACGCVGVRVCGSVRMSM